MGILIDLDQTLIDSQAALPFRKARNWSATYERIPLLLPYPGIPELLKELKEMDVPICVITSAPESYCKRVIRHWNWNINATVCYHDTCYHKPHPEPILKGLDRLGLDATNVIAIGDAATDIQAAKAAGVFSVGALWGSLEKERLQASKPDIICRSVSDLRNTLLEMRRL
jgi:phosphoglycolate phosphatase-like HAD superfamily hydrolase